MKKVECSKRILYLDIAVAIILMFIMLLWRMMVIANNAPDLTGSLLVVGAMAHIAIQVILNIAVVTNSRWLLLLESQK